jgi:hypothetical protein
LAREEAEIMQRKNWKATGALDKKDRSRALDLLGFQSQLLFSSFHNGHFIRLEKVGAALDLIYGSAQAHDRAMLDFCSDDPRLLATNYIPLTDFERAAAATRTAIDAGAAALLIPSACPAGHSPSHLELDPVWAQAEEARVPIVFHVGGGGELLDPNYFRNGLPIPPDFHGGDENFRSVSFMGIPGPPMQTLATLIFDGVLDRFPELRIGVIEQGAGWLPSWMRQMESAMEAFSKLEERLQNLSLRPSEFVRRQIKATPFPMSCSSRRTTPTSKAAAAPSSTSKPAWATEEKRCARPSTRTTSSTSWAPPSRRSEQEIWAAGQPVACGWRLVGDDAGDG